MTHLAHAINAAMQSVAGVAGVTVTYTSDGASASLTAIPASTMIEQSDGAVTVRGTVRDYLIAASDLVIRGRQLRPKRGDRIKEGASTYEVLPPSSNASDYAPLGPYGSHYRVHTRLIER